MSIRRIIVIRNDGIGQGTPKGHGLFSRLIVFVMTTGFLWFFGLVLSLSVLQNAGFDWAKPTNPGEGVPDEGLMLMLVLLVVSGIIGRFVAFGRSR